MTPSAGRDLLSGRTSPGVRRYLDRLLGRLGLGQAAGRALDAGCGDGLVAAWLAARGWSVRGEDREAHPAWGDLEAAGAGRLSFGLHDAQAAGEGGYDLVLVKDVLHHAADPVAALRALSGRVRPGGRLVVLECNRLHPIFYVNLTLLRGHQHFRRARLESLLREAGLETGISRIEARVWPWGGETAQGAFDRLENALEALPPWGPFTAYHAAVWRRPEAA